jgi:hypothetical protein
MQFSQLLYQQPAAGSSATAQDKVVTDLFAEDGSLTKLSINSGIYNPPSTKRFLHVVMALTFASGTSSFGNVQSASMNMTNGIAVDEVSGTTIPPLPRLKSVLQGRFGDESYHPSISDQVIFPNSPPSSVGPFLELLNRADTVNGKETASGTMHFMALYDRVCVCVCVCVYVCEIYVMCM